MSERFGQLCELQGNGETQGRPDLVCPRYASTEKAAAIEGAMEETA
jgi:hypothetical protein